VSVQFAIIDYMRGCSHSNHDGKNADLGHIGHACFSLLVNRAAGRGEKPIHEGVESSTLSAKTQAVQVLRQFFRSR